MICLASFRWVPWIICLQFNRKVLIYPLLLRWMASLLLSVFAPSFTGLQCFRVLGFTKYHALISSELPDQAATFNTVPFRNRSQDERCRKGLRWSWGKKETRWREGSHQYCCGSLQQRTGKDDFGWKQRWLYYISKEERRPGPGSPPPPPLGFTVVLASCSAIILLECPFFLFAHHLVLLLYWGLGVANAELPSWALRISNFGGVQRHFSFCDVY